VPHKRGHNGYEPIFPVRFILLAVATRLLGQLSKMRREKEEARPGLHPRLIFKLAAYRPHPEQEAQQSAEAQHEAWAAFTATVRPNASTAINRIALMLFMTFSFLE
jgi:hypothetical protein